MDYITELRYVFAADLNCHVYSHKFDDGARWPCKDLHDKFPEFEAMTVHAERQIMYSGYTKITRNAKCFKDVANPDYWIHEDTLLPHESDEVSE
jgi:hypothetical protein